MTGYADLDLALYAFLIFSVVLLVLAGKSVAQAASRTPDDERELQEAQARLHAARELRERGVWPYQDAA